jgi:hypothetical protein
VTSLLNFEERTVHLSRLQELVKLLKEYVETTQENLPRKKIAEIFLRILEKEAMEREQELKTEMEWLSSYYKSDRTGI